jgi:hypothetical protein
MQRTIDLSTALLLCLERSIPRRPPDPAGVPDRASLRGFGFKARQPLSKSSLYGINSL